VSPDHDLVARALAEDVGAGDLTSEITVPAGLAGTATITQKAQGVVFGLDVAEAVFAAVDPGLQLTRLGPEGQWREPPAPVLEVRGSVRSILTAERTALNLLGRLSGVATLTARYVRAVDGTGARILDTRKTTPGLRALEKAAVRAGGGVSHRFGLFDMVLVKENHVAAAGGIRPAVRAVRERVGEAEFVVECQTLDEVAAAVEEGAPRVLLDNMDADGLRAAVALVGGRATTEASGGVSLETVRGVAETGVDLISVGALTHSASALDLSLLLKATA
jgi:nicotinate-nucleotide pyrophosphorylase (carboxylating)